MTGEFLHNTSDRTRCSGKYRAEESVELNPGQEIEVSVTAPEDPPIALFLHDGRLQAFGDIERVVIPKIQWGDRQHDTHTLRPGESIFISLKNISDEKACIKLRLDLLARRV